MGVVDFQPLTQTDVAWPHQHVVVGRCDVDVPSLDQFAMLSEACRVLPAAAQQIWQDAWMVANMHDDKDRRQARDWQRSNDTL